MFARGYARRRCGSTFCELADRGETPADTKSADELETAFANIKKNDAQALLVIRSALASAVADRMPISRSKPFSHRATRNPTRRGPEGW
jgi:hypothetical protein